LGVHRRKQRPATRGREPFATSVASAAIDPTSFEGVCPTFHVHRIDRAPAAFYTGAVNFREALHAELAARRRRNARYSLRAFARFLGTDHSTLSQILRSRRSLSAHMVARFGRRLGLSAAFVAEACQQQIAESVLRLARTKSFRPNSRWIATRTGLPLDSVNSALDHLIRHGDLVMESPERWTTTRPAYA